MKIKITDFAVKQKQTNDEPPKAALLAQPETSTNRFPQVWLDVVGEVSPTQYLIKGLIDAKSVSLIFGPSGSGKTFFGIDLVGHIAAGITWRERRVRSGLVVYVAAEAGTSIVRRFKAWRDRLIGDARETPVPLVILTRGANLLSDEDTDALITDIRQLVIEAGIPLAAVVFDTLSRSIPGGDENSPADMTRAVSVADRIREELNSATIFIHHTGKDATKGARGHSALFAASDTVISVTNQAATVEKSRDGLSGESFGFKLDVIQLGVDGDGDQITTCVAAPTDTVQKTHRQPAMTGVTQVALRALREAILEHGQTMSTTSTIPAGVKAVQLERWRAQFKVRYGSDGDPNSSAVRMAFHRGKDALLKADLISISDPFVWVIDE